MTYIGTAGWALPRTSQPQFSADGSHLARYARVFGASEINSSFHRPHRRSTYERWAASVPEAFRFAVKMPKLITHVHRLVGTRELLDAFLDASAGLGVRRACLLVQLAPSFAFAGEVAACFFAELRARYAEDIVVEPRHPSWFGLEPETLLERYRVARVAADPARVPDAAEPGGWAGVAYWRMHGSPRMYYSSYADAALDALAARMRTARARADNVWCIFDNTTSGAATANALALKARLD